MGCWAAAVNHCGLARQFIVTTLPTWWQGPRLLCELPPLSCAYVEGAWILKEVQEVANSLASWSCSPCWTLRRRHKSHTKRPTERIRNLFKNQHFLLPKHTLQYLCVWVFIYAAFFCIFQSQQSETVSEATRQGGSCSAHFISRNERQSLPQKYAKFAAFTEFMVICVALLMLLNLHLTNGIQLPPRSPHSSPPSSTLRHCELHLDDEISAQRALVLPAHSLSVYPCLSLSVCLSSLFGHLSKHFQLHFVHCNFNMRFWWYRCGEIGKPNQQWCSSWSAHKWRHTNANREWELLRIFECNYSCRCRCYSDYSCSLQSPGRQTGWQS